MTDIEYRKKHSDHTDVQMLSTSSGEPTSSAQQKHSFKELLKGPGIRFLFVGGSMTLLDLLLYQLFANVLQISLFGAPSSVSAVWIGTPIVILVNFFVSHRFVWKSSTSKRKTIVPFFGLNLFTGILVQSLIISGVLWVLTTLEWVIIDTSITNLFAKCCAVGVSMILNFFGAKLLFKYDD